MSGLRELHAEHPPYQPRLYPGDVERGDSGHVTFPPVPVMYPGEAAHIIWDGKSLTVTWAVEPAPGFKARLHRLRYRLWPKPAFDDEEGKT